MQNIPDDLEPGIGLDRITASSPRHSAAHQGERSAQDFKAVAAHAVDLSAWHTLQAFEILKASAIAGVTK